MPQLLEHTVGRTFEDFGHDQLQCCATAMLGQRFPLAIPVISSVDKRYRPAMFETTKSLETMLTTNYVVL